MAKIDTLHVKLDLDAREAQRKLRALVRLAKRARRELNKLPDDVEAYDLGRIS